jgi:hypothetical protein
MSSESSKTSPQITHLTSIIASWQKNTRRLAKKQSKKALLKKGEVAVKAESLSFYGVCQYQWPETCFVRWFSLRLRGAWLKCIKNEDFSFCCIRMLLQVYLKAENKAAFSLSLPCFLKEPATLSLRFSHLSGWERTSLTGIEQPAA